MPSVRYFNQTAPFWDFVASMEAQGAQHPLFNGPPDEGRPDASFPYRGRHGHHHPQPPADANENDQDTAPQEHDPHTTESHRHRGRWGGRGGCHGRGGFRGRGFPFQGPPPFWAEFFADKNNEESKSEDYKPEADVFDTPESFVIHVSLPGAKKDDVGISWDTEKSELAIAGVIYRPGDEELLKNLALNERNVGAFERKIRLGSRANPAQVDADAISAKMEDGVLAVTVPKLDSGYVEVKKVDIE